MAKLTDGVGTELHNLIESWTGEKPRISCSCMRWIKTMNKRGTAWTKKNISLITAKLLDEAKKRAVDWRAAPVDKGGSILNAVVNKAWKGAFLIPGSGVLLEPFVKGMVFESIRRAEKKGFK